MRLNWITLDPGTGSCDHSNKISDSTDGGAYLQNQSDYQHFNFDLVL
jgi:hypothetical protein